MSDFFHLSYIQNLILSEMNVANIYDSTTGSLLQTIEIHLCKENIQHSMSANPYFNNISIDNYKQEILPT